jgi:hypothetical protein
VCRTPIGCRGWQCLSCTWGSKRRWRSDRHCLKRSRPNAAVVLCWVLPRHRLLCCSVVVHRRSPSSCNAEHRLLLPLTPPLSASEPSATVSSSAIAGARAARVAAGPPCCHAKTPPFSTGEDPLSTLSSACPRHRTRTSASAPPCLPVADVADCRPLPSAASEPSHLRAHAASGPSSPHTPGFAPLSATQP